MSDRRRFSSLVADNWDEVQRLLDTGAAEEEIEKALRAKDEVPGTPPPMTTSEQQNMLSQIQQKYSPRATPVTSPRNQDRQQQSVSPRGASISTGPLGGAPPQGDSDFVPEREKKSLVDLIQDDLAANSGGRRSPSVGSTPRPEKPSRNSMGSNKASPSPRTSAANARDRTPSRSGSTSMAISMPPPASTAKKSSVNDTIFPAAVNESAALAPPRRFSSLVVDNWDQVQEMLQNGATIEEIEASLGNRIPNNGGAAGRASTRGSVAQTAPQRQVDLSFSGSNPKPTTTAASAAAGRTTANPTADADGRQRFSSLVLDNWNDVQVLLAHGKTAEEIEEFLAKQENKVGADGLAAQMLGRRQSEVSEGGKPSRNFPSTNVEAPTSPRAMLEQSGPPSARGSQVVAPSLVLGAGDHNSSSRASQRASQSAAAGRTTSPHGSQIRSQSQRPPSAIMNPNGSSTPRRRFSSLVVEHWDEVEAIFAKGGTLPESEAYFQWLEQNGVNGSLAAVDTWWNTRANTLGADAGAPGGRVSARRSRSASLSSRPTGFHMQDNPQDNSFAPFTTDLEAPAYLASNTPQQAPPGALFGHVPKLLQRNIFGCAQHGILGCHICGMGNKVMCRNVPQMLFPTSSPFLGVPNAVVGPNAIGYARSGLTRIARGATDFVQLASREMADRHPEFLLEGQATGPGGKSVSTTQPMMGKLMPLEVPPREVNSPTYAVTTGPGPDGKIRRYLPAFPPMNTASGHRGLFEPAQNWLSARPDVSAKNSFVFYNAGLSAGAGNDFVGHGVMPTTDDAAGCGSLHPLVHDKPPGYSRMMGLHATAEDLAAIEAHQAMYRGGGILGISSTGAGGGAGGGGLDVGGNANANNGGALMRPSPLSPRAAAAGGGVVTTPAQRSRQNSPRTGGREDGFPLSAAQAAPAGSFGHQDHVAPPKPALTRYDRNQDHVGQQLQSPKPVLGRYDPGRKPSAPLSPERVHAVTNPGAMMPTSTECTTSAAGSGLHAPPGGYAKDASGKWAPVRPAQAAARGVYRPPAADDDDGGGVADHAAAAHETRASAANAGAPGSAGTNYAPTEPEAAGDQEQEYPTVAEDGGAAGGPPDEAAEGEHNHYAYLSSSNAGTTSLSGTLLSSNVPTIISSGAPRGNIPEVVLKSYERAGTTVPHVAPRASMLKSVQLSRAGAAPPSTTTSFVFSPRDDSSSRRAESKKVVVPPPAFDIRGERPEKSTFKAVLHRALSSREGSASDLKMAEGRESSFARHQAQEASSFSSSSEAPNRPRSRSTNKTGAKTVLTRKPAVPTAAELRARERQMKGEGPTVAVATPPGAARGGAEMVVVSSASSSASSSSLDMLPPEPVVAVAQEHGTMFYPEQRRRVLHAPEDGRRSEMPVEVPARPPLGAEVPGINTLKLPGKPTTPPCCNCISMSSVTGASECSTSEGEALAPKSSGLAEELRRMAEAVHRTSTSSRKDASSATEPSDCPTSERELGSSRSRTSIGLESGFSEPRSVGTGPSRRRTITASVPTSTTLMTRRTEALTRKNTLTQPPFRVGRAGEGARNTGPGGEAARNTEENEKASSTREPSQTRAEILKNVPATNNKNERNKAETGADAEQGGHLRSGTGTALIMPKRPVRVRSEAVSLPASSSRTEDEERTETPGGPETPRTILATAHVVGADDVDVGTLQDLANFDLPPTVPPSPEVGQREANSNALNSTTTPTRPQVDRKTALRERVANLKEKLKRKTGSERKEIERKLVAFLGMTDFSLADLERQLLQVRQECSSA